MYQNPHRFRNHMTSLPAQRLLFRNGVCQLNGYCSTCKFYGALPSSSFILKTVSKPGINSLSSLQTVNTLRKSLSKPLFVFIFFIDLQTLDPPATLSPMAPRVIYAYNPIDGVNGAPNSPNPPSLLLQTMSGSSPPSQMLQQTRFSKTSQIT